MGKNAPKRGRGRECCCGMREDVLGDLWTIWVFLISQNPMLYFVQHLHTDPRNNIQSRVPRGRPRSSTGQLRLSDSCPGSWLIYTTAIRSRGSILESSTSVHGVEVAGCQCFLFCSFFDSVFAAFLIEIRRTDAAIHRVRGVVGW